MVVKKPGDIVKMMKDDAQFLHGSTKERLWWQLRNMFQMTEQFYVDDLVQNMLDPLLLNSTANITIVVV